MIVAETREELLRATDGGRQRARRGGDRDGLALVPTMGSLHEGHLSLVDLARGNARRVVVSIFVNPLQFAPGEDLESYPRDETRDRRLLAERGADVLFVPTVEEMYPHGPPSVTVDPGPLGDGLCGAHRPDHFRGVLTVVARLFGLVRPDLAVFGRKDFQQSVLVRRMARDLEMGVDVLVAPVVREDDGLAMSSRNVYLSAEERAQAPVLGAALAEARRQVDAGERSAAALIELVRSRVAERPLCSVQYVSVVDGETLDSVGRVRPGAVLAAAIFCGDTRLIDNMELA